MIEDTADDYRTLLSEDIYDRRESLIEAAGLSQYLIPGLNDWFSIIYTRYELLIASLSIYKGSTSGRPHIDSRRQVT